MTPDAYNPDRDVKPEFLATVARWIELTGEVFVVARFLRAAGAKGYAFIGSTDALHSLIDLCAPGTEFVVFKERQLPIRGEVTDDFIRDSQIQIADGKEYLCVCMAPPAHGHSLLSGTMGESHETLVEDLEDVRGQLVALGPCPRFVDPDNDSMKSAAKGGIDGAR